MDPTGTTTTDAKYQKLAQEYSKVRHYCHPIHPQFLLQLWSLQMRAQANVLKKAIVEEQTKSGQTKETIRLKEVELRRSEQEVDSLTFRNKQLELRVATLQCELEKQQGKQKRNLLLKSNHNNSNSNGNGTTNDNMVAEEFQKKIVENAQLISLLADKNHELELCQRNLQALEENVHSQLFKQSFVEDGLRHELQELCLKHSQLEVKLLEAGRANSDEDNRSVATDNSSLLADTAPLSGVGVSVLEERLVCLEKELAVLRTKHELLQLQEQSRQQQQSASDGNEGGDMTSSQEEILYEHFAHRIDDILLEKQLAESKLVSYMAECDSLKDHLEVLTDELGDQERRLGESQRKVQTVEDHLHTTRLNYEEHISVLTEQVLSLSDQLAAASN